MTYDWIDDEDRKEEKIFNEDIDFWFVSDGQISQGLVPMAYEKMDIERAKEVRNELEKAIEFVEDN